MIFRLLKLNFLFIISMGIISCAPYYIKKSTHKSVRQLAHQIDLQIAEPEFETAFLGVMVQSTTTGEILYQHNANKVMMPASNEKIITAAVALMKFGTDFKYETKVYATGSISEGILNGDLIIVGSGDPTIGYRFCENKDTCMIFQSWANALKERGIHKINGNLIGIDDVFDDELIGNGWSLDDLSYYYAAQINGLMLNENYIDITIQADSVNDEAKITFFPYDDYLEIISQLKISDAVEDETELSLHRIENTNKLVVKGILKKGDTYNRSVSIHNPTLFFLRGLRHELEKCDIACTGKDIDADDLAESLNLAKEKLIHTHYSPPFADVIKVLMKKSQNLYAESLVKLLGFHFGSEGSFEEGEKIIKSTLRRFGLEKDSYQYYDGSGLSRYNYVSPAQIVKILRRMYFNEYGEIFRNSLPIAGVDGTIGYRMKGTVAQGKIFAKTGTISNVRCLSGYAMTRDDEMLVFSIIVNNFLCDVNVVMDMQDRICMLLASFSRNRPLEVVNMKRK